MTAPAQTAGPALPQIDDPGAIGGVRPRIADLRGRCVIVQPLSIARNVPGVQAGTTQDRITANIFVLDGGPLEFGGKPEKYVPHTLVVSTPYLAEGVYISQTNMVAALTPSLPSPQKPQGGLVIGVISQGRASKPEHNPPWNLVVLEPNDPRRGLASHMLQQFFTGAFVNPEPQQTGAPTPPGGALAYTHATTMPHNPVTGQPIPNLAEFATTTASVSHLPAQAATQSFTTGGAPIDPGYAAYLAAQQAQAAPVAPAAPPVDPAYLAWLASQQAATTPSVAPAAPVDVAPTGWPQDAWDRLAPEQRASIRASMPAAAPAANSQPPF